jgi:hypothetical protein
VIGVDNPGMATPTTTTVNRSGPAIRAVLTDLAPQEGAEFETEFRRALAETDEDFDTSRVDALIGRWWARAIVLLNPDLAADTAWERIKAGDASDLVAQWRPQPDGSQRVYRKIADRWVFSHIQPTVQT